MTNVLLRFARAVRNHALAGVLLALPALVFTFFIFPMDVGYLLISTAASILYVSAKRVNRPEEIDEDFEEIPGQIVRILVASTFLAMNAQLLTVLAMVKALNASLGLSLFTIAIAMLFPVVDRLLAKRHLLLSVSGIGVWVAFTLGKHIIDGTSYSDNGFWKDSLRAKTLY